MQTLIGSMDGNEKIRKARLAWIAETLRAHIANVPNKLRQPFGKGNNA